MTQKEHTLTVSTGKALLRVATAVFLTLALMVVFLVLPIVARTSGSQAESALSRLNLPLRADVVHALVGLTLTKKATGDTSLSGEPSATSVDQGQVITYELAFTNNSGQAWDDVDIVDKWPNDVVSCVSVTGDPGPPSWSTNGTSLCNSDQEATWTKPQIEAPFPDGGTAVLTWVAQIDSPLPNGYIISNNFYSATATIPGGPLIAVGPTQTMTVNAPEFEISKSVSPTPTVLVGQDLVYTIVVTNVGKLDATGVTITDVVPANTTVSPVSVSNGGSEAGGVVSWPTFTLVTGTSATRVFTVTVDDPSLVPGDFIVNQTYGVSGTNVHPASWGVGQPVTVTVDSAITLTVNKSDFPFDPVTLDISDTPLTYTITVTNGPGSTSGVSGVVISDVLPAEVTLNSITVPSGTFTTGTVGGSDAFTITSTTIPNGGVLTATVVVTVNAPLADGTVITNTGTVTLPNSSNTTVAGTIEETTTIRSPVIIELDKTVTPNIASPGDVLTYTITITNSGATSTTVSLGDFLNSVFNPNTPLSALRDIPLNSGETTTVTFRAIVGAVDTAQLLTVPANYLAWTAVNGWNVPGATTFVNGPATDARITSPARDASSCSVLSLVTNNNFTPGAGGIGHVQVSDDGFVTFDEAQTLVRTGPPVSRVDISQFAGSSSVQVRYLFDGPAGSSWTINSTALECITPAAVDNTVYTQNVYTNAIVSADFISLGVLANQVLTDTAPVTITAPSITMTKVATWTPNVGGAADITNGATVTYTYAVTNTGTETFTLTTADLFDDRIANVGAQVSPALPVTLSPFGDSITLTVAVPVTTVDNDASPLLITNNAVVTGNTVAGVVTATATANVPLTYTANITIAKSQTTYTPANPAGKNDVVDFDITITNDSPVTLTVTGLSDVLQAGGLLLPQTVSPTTPFDIGPNGTVNTTVSVTVTQAMIDNALALGVLTNTATVTADDVLGINTNLTDTDVATAPITASVAISIAKIAEYPGADANIGETITYTYRITNTGSVTITTLTIFDDRLGDLSAGPFSPALPLPVDNVTEVSRTIVVTQGTIESTAPAPFDLINTVDITATSTFLPGASDTQTDSATVPLAFNSGITVTKTFTTSSGTTPVNNGEVVTYTFRVENTGDVTYTAGTLVDTFTGTSTRPDATLSNSLTVPPGVLTFTQVITINANDIAEALPGFGGDGNLNNQANVNVQIPVLGVTDSASDTAAVPLASQIVLSMTKTASPNTDVRPGDTVVYTYILENNSGATGQLLPNWLTDDSLTIGAVAGDAFFNPGEIKTIVRSKVFTYSDLSPSLAQTNVATAVATIGGISSVTTVTETVNLTYTHDITITKQASVASATIGDQIVYTYTVVNADVPVTLTVVDDKVGAIFNGSLAAGETRVFTSPYTVAAGDYPLLTNVVTATAVDQLVSVGDTVTDTDTVSIPVSTGGITVTKLIDDSTPTFGQTIVYTFIVSNSTGLRLSPLTLVDDQLGPIATTTIPTGTLVYSTTVPYLVSTSDFPGITNTVVVTGIPTALTGITFTDQATASFVIAFTPTIDIDKVTAVDPVSRTANVGDVVNFNFNVQNTSPVPVSVEVGDQKLGATFGPTVLTVSGAGSSFSFPAPGVPLTKTMTVGDFTFDPVSGNYIFTNTAVATSTAFGSTGINSDVYTITLLTNQDIQVTKVADLDPAGNGQVVNYAIVVENTGGIDFTNVEVYDPLIQPTPISAGAVAAGSTITVTIPYTVSVAEANAGALTNTVHITGTTALSGVIATDTATETIVTRRVLTDVTITTAPALPAQVNISQLFTATITPDIPEVQPVDYTWDFGDGTGAGPSSSITTTHAFTAPGTYTVTVVASNGVSTVTDTLVVTVQDQPPVVDELLNNSPKIVLPAPALGATVDFTTTLTSGTNVTYQFDWDDGTLSPVITSPTRSHGYLAPGVYTVTVTVSNGIGTDVGTTTVVITSLTFDKDATPAPGSQVGPGDPIQYTLTITNRPSSPPTAVGPVTIVEQLPAGVSFNNLVTLSGPAGATVSGYNPASNVLTITKATLAANTTLVLGVNTTVSTTVVSGQILTNTATAYSDQVNRTDTANSLGYFNVFGNPLFDFGTDVVTHVVFFNAELTVSKTVNNPVPDYGDTITYTITVTNSGTLPLTVTVTDPNLGGVLTSNVPLGPFDPPLSFVISDNVDINYVPFFMNTVTATGQISGGGQVITSDFVIVSPNASLSYELIKVANPVTATVGDVINYSFRVRNLGPFTLTTVSLNDPLLGGNLGIQFVNVPPFGVTPLTAVGNYTVTESDLLRPGPAIVNTALATATNPLLPDVGETDTATVTLVYTKSLSIVKTPSQTTFDGTGQTITYTFVVTNNGNVPLYNVAVVDDLTGFTTTIPVLSPTVGVTAGSAQYTSQFSDLQAGAITNTVVATGSTIISGDEVTATDTVVVIGLPNLSIAKSADAPYPSGTDVIPGNQIVYRLQIFNSGASAPNAQITDQVPSDVTLVGVSGTGVVTNGNNITITTSLPAGTAFLPVETRLITVTVNDVSSPVVVITNNATLSSTTSLTQSNDVTHTIYAQPDLQITKSAVPAAGSEVQTGDTIVYTLYVVNNGAGPASNMVITDTPPVGQVTVTDIDQTQSTADGKTVLGNRTGNAVQFDMLPNITLDGGDSFTVSITATVNSLPPLTVISNTAYAAFEGGTPLNVINYITNSNTITHITAGPDLQLVKTADPSAVEAGGTFTYTIVVNNAGGGVGTNILLTDTLDSQLNLIGTPSVAGGGSANTNGNAITVTAPSLASNASLTVTIVATVSTNVPTGTQIINTAYVTSDEGSSASDSVTITVTSPQTGTTIYLPIIMRNFVSGPDLIVESVSVVSGQPEVVIKNIGNATANPPYGGYVNKNYGGFWVDLYAFAPADDPGLGNIVEDHDWKFYDLQGRDIIGKVWFVTGSIAPGDAITLTVGGTYYSVSKSSPSSITAGRVIYGQVDSINLDNPTNGGGAVEELVEDNNTSAGLLSTALEGVEVTVEEVGTSASLPDNTPPRER